MSYFNGELVQENLTVLKEFCDDVEVAEERQELKLKRKMAISALDHLNSFFCEDEDVPGFVNNTCMKGEQT